MKDKLKKFLKKYKKAIKYGLFVIFILILFLFAYKLFFYSDKEKDLYGVRLRDIEENKFTNKEITEVKEKTTAIEGIKNIKINVKGRLIKLFVTFDNEVSNNDIKLKFNESLSFISDKVRSYYDITMYAIKEEDKKLTYPVIGYKHKDKTEVNYKEF